jgi:uncharacterized protein YjiS (DUF1127 family)
MHELDAEQLRDAGLALVGKIVAVHSHEVTNAFSVINEMAGLQLDILKDAAKGDPVDLLELESVSKKIRHHVRRGEATVRSINWLAHSVEQISQVFDVSETLEKIISVAEHWMTRRRARFALELPEESTRLEARLFTFAIAVFLAIDVVTPTSSGDQEISVGYTNVKGGLELTVASDGGESSIPEAEANLNILKSLMKALGGELRQPLDFGPADRVVLFVPSQRHACERGETEKKEEP